MNLACSLQFVHIAIHIFLIEFDYPGQEPLFKLSHVHEL